MSTSSNSKLTGFSTMEDILSQFKTEKDKYVSREYQQYGYELAEELGDLKHKALYIKLAKETSRGLLDAARSFVKDADNARSKGRLFMWKLSKLKEQAKQKGNI
jgi:hypothetical protein